MGWGTDYLPLGYLLAKKDGEEARRGLKGTPGEVEIRVESRVC